MTGAWLVLYKLSNTETRGMFTRIVLFPSVGLTAGFSGRNLVNQGRFLIAIERGGVFFLIILKLKFDYFKKYRARFGVVTEFRLFFKMLGLIHLILFSYLSFSDSWFIIRIMTTRVLPFRNSLDLQNLRCTTRNIC